jgi:RNA-directed DNA polymerase
MWWKLINWNIIMSKICKIQCDTVIANLNGNRLQMYNKQRELITSFEGCALAIKNTISNSGGKTPGIDKVLWDSPEKKWEAIYTLNRIVKNPNQYKAQPLMRVMIPKGNGDMRPLGIPTLMDRAVQAVYKLAIDPVVESTSDMYSFGFRKYRSTHHAIALLKNILERKDSPEYILDADIKKCFDRISHSYLMKHTPICDKHVLKEWLKCGVYENKEIKETNEGTPQGGIISPILCNIALNGLEKRIKENKGESKWINVIRYADDLIVTSKKKETLKEIKEEIINFLKERGLELNNEKTKIVKINEGFDYLGFNLKKKSNRLIIQPSEKSIESLKTKIKETIRPQKSIELIIMELNPILRGWIEHKRISKESVKRFKEIEEYMKKKLMEWIKEQKGDYKENLKKYQHKTKENKWHLGLWNRYIINPTDYKSVKLKMCKHELNPYIEEDKAKILKDKKKQLRDWKK